MITLVFALTFLLAAAVLYRSAIHAARMKAKFKLYAVRDQLIYLVAIGKLAEDSHIFKHYYPLLNKLLEATPKVGIDDLLHAIFNYKGNLDDFDKAFREGKRRMKELEQDPAMQSLDVKCVVADYYDGLRFLIMTHSRAARIAYYAARYIGRSAIATIDRYLPRRVANVTKTLRFADSEVTHLRQGLCDATS